MIIENKKSTEDSEHLSNLEQKSLVYKKNSSTSFMSELTNCLQIIYLLFAETVSECL